MYSSTKKVASSYKKEEMKETLIQYDIAAKVRDHRYMSLDEKNTPREKLLKTLIEIQDEDQKTIQHVKALIADIKAADCDLNYYSRKGETPISVACVRNKPAILKLLIEEKADYHFTHSAALPFFEYFSSPTNLLRATRVRAIECMKILIEAGASPSEEDESFHIAPLHVVAEHGQIDELKLLLLANNSLSYESLKNGLLMGISFFAINNITNIAVEHGVFDKINRVFKR